MQDTAKVLMSYSITPVVINSIILLPGLHNVVYNMLTWESKEDRDNDNAVNYNACINRTQNRHYLVDDRYQASRTCSKGPGAKLYTYTVYALSDLPKVAVPASEVSRNILLIAIKDITLGSAMLNVFYSRQKIE